MVLVRLINNCNKVIFERVINSSLEDIPFSKIIDVLNVLFSVPHDTYFIIQDINNINLNH